MPVPNSRRLGQRRTVTGLSIGNLKPENIMSVPDDHSRGRVKILDFGLAKHLHARCVVSKKENAAGDSFHCYEPGPTSRDRELYGPEQLEWQPVDARTDIYALAWSFMKWLQAPILSWAGRPPTIANILKLEHRLCGYTLRRLLPNSIVSC